MARATLLLIDIQNDYFPGGAFPLVGPEAAARNARVLLDAFRAAGLPVVHVQHGATDPDATFLRAGSPGADLHPLVAALDGEAIVPKQHPNSFLETDLAEVLTTAGTERLVVAGMMSSMCVDATVRAALDLGIPVVLAHDACAAPDLTFDGREIAGHQVHTAFMAALSGAGAETAGSSAIAREFDGIRSENPE
jgi:nicotinamidase-related amidase